MHRRFLLFVWLFVANAACTSVPKGKSGIDSVTIRNASAVDESDTLDKIATAETPKFLGLFRGVVYDYEVFDRFVLQRDLARIERFYRARGFYDARARAGRVIQKNDNHVAVEIVVEEGKPVVVDDLEVVWPNGSGVPDDVKLHAYLAAKKLVRPNRPFDEDKYKDAEEAVKKECTDKGYAFTKVTRTADVNVTTHKAVVTYTVQPDLPSKFGPITITGLGEIPEDIVRRTIDIKEGDKYSTAEIDSASAALSDLEVFASVRIVPDLSDPPPANHVVPLKVTLEPAKLRAVRLGGGVELDQLKADVHGVVAWEDHNFLGNLRDVQVSFKPGVVLYPTRLNNLVTPNKPLPEEKLQITFKQPSFLEARTEGFVRPAFNVYPIIVPQTTPTLGCAVVAGTQCTQEAASAANATVLGYIEPKIEVGLDRLFFRHLFVSLSQNEQVESPFAYVGTLDNRLKPILLSYPELKAILDFTDSKLHPHAGFYVSNIVQMAGGGPFAGERTFVGNPNDVKIQPEVRGYIPLGRRLTVAMRATTGFIFPQNWGDYIRHNLNDFANPNAPPISDTDVRDLEIDLFRGFLSGGPSENRGYPARTIGAYTFVPFFNPASVQNQVKNGEACVDTTASGKGTSDACRTPVGGMSLWEASAELRILITGPLSAATFCDGSDVSPSVADIRINHPHISCGLGGRYDTPVGPIRLDIGYRIPGLQYPSGDPLEPSDEQIGTIFGAPVAISAGIGEAF